MVNLSKKALASAAMLLASATLLDAGIMSNNVPVQTYRDFAENRGAFAADATNVTVYDNNGNALGVIPRMMSFDSVVDGGWSTLTGGASFIATVAHNNATNVTFATRFGATSGTAFYDSYRFVAYNRAWGGSTNYTYDYAAPRLNKIVTEATHTNYLTDTSILHTMPGRDVLRVGGGTQSIGTGPGQSTGVAGGYAFLTGGTIRFSGETVRIPGATSLPSNGGGVYYENQSVNATHPGSEYNSYSFTYNNQLSNATKPLDIGVAGGDSGSGSWVYNDNTSAWEYVGAGQSGGGSGLGAFSQMRSGNGWAVALIESYNAPTITPTAAAGTILMSTTDASGAGTFTQGSTSWSYIGLADTVRGDTSTVAANGSSTTVASNAQMDATRNLIFAGDGGTIQLAGSVDTGAGSLTFNADYTLTNGGDASRRLNSAGMIINAGATVTTQLTGATGDEWRKIGDGTLVVSGTGANAADLNIGGAGLVILDRTGGAAARNVKINGGDATVRLVGANQISGDVVFGHRGGTLDLYGNNFTDAAITHLDLGGRIANTRAGTTSTFTFTGSGTQAYLGEFADGGSLANGLLNVAYTPGATGSVWKLSGVNTNAGTWTVNGGEVRVEGVHTLHAGGYVAPNDFVTAVFNTGTVNVASGAQFTVGANATANAVVNLADNATFSLLTGGAHTGNVNLGGTGATYAVALASGQSAQSGLVSGTGRFVKTGAGRFDLTNNGNTFSGEKILTEGIVTGTSLAALGNTAVNKWQVGPKGVIGVTGALVADVKAKVTTTSNGTLAILNSIPTAPVNMGGHSQLFLGSIGDNAIGTLGDGIGLTGWSGTSLNGWNLGGGGGTLTLHNRLVGTGRLTVGNGENTGVVALTGNNTFSGGTVVNAGATLRASSASALGSGTVEITYGGAMAPGTGASAVLAKINTASAGVLALEGTDTSTLNFAANGLNNLALGANGTATYSGTLAAGTSGYRFGGAGGLTVSSTLGGAHNLVVDGQGSTTGITTLTGTNTFTGTVHVSGGTLHGETGAHALRIGSSGAIGSGNAVNLAAGGVLDLNGHAVNAGSLTGSADSALLNASGTASTLTLNQTTDTTMAGIISGFGAVNLVKNGAGMLTLAGSNSQTGTLTVNAGTLRVGNANALGNASVQVNNGGSLNLNGSSAAGRTITLAGNGNGSIGALHNSTANTISIGTVALSGNATLTGVGTGSIFNVDNYALNGHSLAVTSARVNLSDNGVSNGTLALGNNTVGYLGGTQSGNANGGSLVLNTGSHLMVRDYSNGDVANRKTLVLNGGRLSNGVLDNGGGGQSTVSNNIVVEAAGGTISANNTGFGLDLRLAGDISGTGTLTLNGGRRVDLRGGVTNFAGNLVLGTELISNSASAQTFSGVVSGGGALTKTGTGTLTLAGNNTYTGNTTISGGVLDLGTTGKLYNGGWNNTSTITVNAGGTWRMADYSYGGVGQLADYAARRVLNGGTIEVTGSTHASGQNFTVNASGGTFRYAPVDVASTLTLTGNGNGNIVVNGQLTYDTNANIVVAEVMQGSGSIRKTGEGILTLSAANTYTGNTTVAAGVLLATNPGALIGYNTAGKVSVASGATLGVTVSGWTSAQITTLRANADFAAGSMLGINTDMGDHVYADTITGTVGIAKLGADTMTLTGVNTHTGGVGVYGGTLLAGNASAFGAGGALTVGGTGTLDLNGYTMTGSAVSVHAGELRNGTVNAASIDTRSGRISATLTGTAALTKNGEGTTVLTADNSYAGDTVINGGTLRIGDGGTTGSLGLGANVTNNGALVFNRADNLTVSKIITGTGSLTQESAGTLTLTGANTYSGGTTVSAGTLIVGANGSIGNGPIRVDGTLRLDRTATTTYTGALSGTGNIVHNAAVIVMEGANTFAGNTTLNGGAYVLNSAVADSANQAFHINAGGWLALGAAYAGNTATIGSLSGTGGKIDTAYGTTAGVRTLSVNQTVDGNYAGTMANAGNRLLGLTKTGSANLTLSGNNTYSGATTVTAGTLTAGHNNAFGTSAVTVSGSGTLHSGTGRSLANAFTVNNGGTLVGNATFNGAVVVNNGGTLSAGTVSSVGSQTFTGGVTLAAGSTLVWNFVGDATAAGTHYDTHLVSAGNFTLASGVTLKIAGLGVDYSGSFWDTSRDFSLVTKSGTGTITGNFSTLDTSLAGAYSAEGAWSVLTGDNGDLVARWTSSGESAVNYTPVPEPSTYGLMGAGSMLAVAFVRRRRKAALAKKAKLAE